MPAQSLGDESIAIEVTGRRLTGYLQVDIQTEKDASGEKKFHILIWASSHANGNAYTILHKLWVRKLKFLFVVRDSIDGGIYAHGRILVSDRIEPGGVIYVFKILAYATEARPVNDNSGASPTQPSG